MDKLLIIDLTDFYGGGQKFVLSLSEIFSNSQTHLYTAVRCQDLFNKLPNERSVFLGQNGFLSDIKTINKIIKEEGIKKVILNGNGVIYIAPFVNSEYKIAYKHTSNNAFWGIRRFLGPILLNFSYLFCDKIVLLFEKAKEEVYFFNRSKVSIINNGVYLKNTLRDISTLNRKKVVLGVLSRIESNKGLEWLIDIFLKEFHQNPLVELRIAGSGPCLTYFKNKLISFGAVNVFFDSFIDNVEDFLMNVDVFILPSKFETFPLSILEAMNASLPIIATNTGGVSEMVKDHYNGILLNYGDDLGLKEAIDFFLQNSEARFTFGCNSKYLVKEKFDIINQVFKIQQL